MKSKKVVEITYFVHGTSVDNELHMASGWHDTGLSELGRRQSRELEVKIKDKEFDVVFCSDLKRAVESAEIVFGDRGIDIIQDKRLRECNYGDFTRRNSEEMDALILNYVDIPFPNGESYKDVERRVKEFLNDLLKASYKQIAIVAHRAPQLALEVLLNGKTWERAVTEDWRSKEPKEWRPGWEYVLKG